MDCSGQLGVLYCAFPIQSWAGPGKEGKWLLRSELIFSCSIWFWCWLCPPHGLVYFYISGGCQILYPPTHHWTIILRKPSICQLFDCIPILAIGRWFFREIQGETTRKKIKSKIRGAGEFWSDCDCSGRNLMLHTIFRSNLRGGSFFKEGEKIKNTIWFRN